MVGVGVGVRVGYAYLAVVAIPFFYCDKIQYSSHDYNNDDAPW